MWERKTHRSYSPVCSSFIWMLFFSSVVDIFAPLLHKGRWEKGLRHHHCSKRGRHTKGSSGGSHRALPPLAERRQRRQNLTYRTGTVQSDRELSTCAPRVGRKRSSLCRFLPLSHQLLIVVSYFVSLCVCQRPRAAASSLMAASGDFSGPTLPSPPSGRGEVRWGN